VKADIGSWISFDDISHLHQALGYRTPTEIFARSKQQQQDYTLDDQKAVQTNLTTSIERIVSRHGIDDDAIEERVDTDTAMALVRQKHVVHDVADRVGQG
jgi:hypothetical protein